MRRQAIDLALAIVVWAAAAAGLAADKPKTAPSRARAARAERVKPLDDQRIDALAALLPASPRAPGPAIGDRAAWETVAADRRFRRVVAEAEQLLAQPVVAMTDDDYLDFSRTGNRTRGQKVMGRRYGRLGKLVLAECMENRGRFLPAIEGALLAYCSDKSWTLPAHDRSLAVFNGDAMSIDLHSSNLTWQMATTCAWLQGKLRSEVRQRVAGELERRTFAPYLEAVLRQGRGASWHTGTSNWNAVCTAGVVGAALAIVEPRRERAVFAAAAERSAAAFLSGFTADGYCSEGMGYWNYGFGHFVLLAETLVQATGGKLDLLDDKRAAAAAAFGQNIEILPGVYPAFADCSVGARPDPRLSAFLSRRYGWGWKTVEEQGLLLAAGPGGIAELAVYGFPNTASRTPSAPATAGTRPPRFWFFEAGILIGRPAAADGMGVALKGGHNAELHNHNDLGSFVVAVGKGTPLVDPGGEVYTARTFSGRRYESNLLNSFGHPVPIVAGQLQRTGRAAAAGVLRSEFSDARDRLAFDLASAYAVPGLQRLERSFEFSREGRGSLRIVDEVEFGRPESFGIALVTFGPWKQEGPARLVVGDGTEAVRVEVAAEGAEAAALVFRHEEIKEDRGGKALPVRLGFDLPTAARKARLTTTIVPVKP